MSNAVATVSTNARQMAEYFAKSADKFKSLMPPKDVDRFLRIVNNAILKDPQIAEASTQSVFLECQKAATDGLVLDGREAALTRFRTKRGDQYVIEVVYIPMLRGLRKIVSRAPQIATWDAALVYENEYHGNDEQGRPRFMYERGVNPILVHRPIVIGERGQVVAAYSVVKLKTGEVLVDLLTRGQLDKIKKRTKSKKQDGTITGPWATDEDEMFIKTVARHHFKSLPLEPEQSAAFERIDGLYDLDGDEAHTIDNEPLPEPPKAVANKRKTSAAEKLAAAKPKETKPQQEVDHDTETGEIIEHEAGEGDEPSGEFNPEDDF